MLLLKIWNSGLQPAGRHAELRGQQIFLNTQILNKIRAGIDTLLKKEQCHVSH
jgi:hypothetical protein